MHLPNEKYNRNILTIPSENNNSVFIDVRCILLPKHIQYQLNTTLNHKLELKQRLKNLQNIIFNSMAQI